MLVRRLPNPVVVLLMCLGMFGAFGPHLLMLGFRAAGARPPAALVYFCVLHNPGGGGASASSHPLRVAWPITSR